MGSWFTQALIARRQTDFCFDAETMIVDFDPKSFQQMAGLTCYYSADKYHYIYITRTSKTSNEYCRLPLVTDLVYCSYPMGQAVVLPETGAIWLKAQVRYDRIQFFYATEKDAWKQAVKSSRSLRS